MRKASIVSADRAGLRNREAYIEWPFIYLIMLNWNGKQHLEYSIPSVLKTDYPNYQLLIVDNASLDGSVLFVQKNYPQVELIVNQRNLGWAGGNNVGIRYALERHAEWLVLINNDILVDPRWLRDAVKAAGSDIKIGLVGFDVYGEYVKTPREEFYAAQNKYDHVAFGDTEVIFGCALMVRKDVFHTIGLIDEVYFIYNEEEDFEFRARSAGYRMIRTNIPLWHYSEGWAATMPLRSAYLSTRNWLRLNIKTKNYGIWDILMWTKQVFYLSCWPFRRVDRNNAPERRTRPSNIFVNFWILLAAVGWNLLHFRQTLRMRKLDQERILQALHVRDETTVSRIGRLRSA
jgi:hypothetical protein